MSIFYIAKTLVIAFIIAKTIIRKSSDQVSWSILCELLDSERSRKFNIK